MITISEPDAEARVREFFRPEFVSQQLGKPGQWQGGIAERQRLSNPVTAEALTRALQGIRPDGEPWVRCDPLNPGRVGGWQFTLGAGGQLSVLWALAPSVFRARIRQAHNRAVEFAVADFEYTVNGRPWLKDLLAARERDTLSAKFQSGASPEQMPRLETKLILINLVRRSGHPSTGYQPEQLAQLHARMQRVYRRVLRNEVLWELGDRVQIPRELGLRMLSASAEVAPGAQAADWKRPLHSSQLFTAWQQQAETWGWGGGAGCQSVSCGTQKPHLAQLRSGLDAQTPLQFTEVQSDRSVPQGKRLARGAHPDA